MYNGHRLRYIRYHEERTTAIRGGLANETESQVLFSMDRVTPDTLKIKGTPDEIVQVEGVASYGHVDVVAGFTVIKATDGGKHDGHSAHVFTLADSMGGREIGRLVVRDDVSYHEECLEWERVFPNPGELERFVTECEREKAEPVVTVEQDLCWDGYNSVERCIAEMSAIYGVSLTVVNPRGPGGGWPVVNITGLRENVRRALKEGWHVSDEEMVDYMS